MELRSAVSDVLAMQREDLDDLIVLPLVRTALPGWRETATQRLTTGPMNLATVGPVNAIVTTVDPISAL